MRTHLEEARAAFARRAWNQACDGLAAADRESPLPPEDIERYAIAAHLVGLPVESADLWARAHHAYVAAGAVDRAARCAFWLAAGLLDRGDLAQCSGWVVRARRLLDDAGADCPEQGYLILPDAILLIGGGDLAAAAARFVEAAAIGQRFRDVDLVALARHGQGRTLIRQGLIGEGLALLDEAMVAVTAGEVSPLVAGDVYCGVLSGCHEVFDWRRAQEWTTALARWCGEQPDLVPYRGYCLLRRSELLLLHGSWPDARAEAERACRRLAQPAGQPGLGAAWYQLAEVLRLTGAGEEAEEAYRQAMAHGRRPQPGLALLRLAQGDTGGAFSAIRGAVEATRDARARPPLLQALADIAVAVGDVAMARAAADELAAIADALGAPYLRAVARQCDGAVLLAAGRERDALAPLREAEQLWRELGAPYEVARTRALSGLACRASGDEAGARAELAAALDALRALGAAVDAARVERLIARPPMGGSVQLTARELEVLRLVAGGQTNRAIGDRLAISEKTVARHVSNIFLKLGLSSRAAATAYAYRHHLIPT